MMSKEERQERRIAKQAEKLEKKNLKIYEKYMEQAVKEAKKAYDINEDAVKQWGTECIHVDENGKVIYKNLQHTVANNIPYYCLQELFG